MSEYLVKRQSLENIADEIRVLSGTTEPLGLTEMATNVNDANDEVADQTDLIAQVVSALQGKSVPGGGEDVTAETATYTNLLTDLEAAVDALPDAGHGAIETCTVVLRGTASNYRPYYCSYTAVGDNGNIMGAAIGPNSAIDITLTNVVCGSAVTVRWYNSGNTSSLSNATIIASPSSSFSAYLITAPASDTATITYAGGGGGN